MSVFIIAEAGVNHNGSIELAKKLVDIASSSGVDAIKFQTFKARNLVTKTAPKADYQIQNMKNKDSQYDLLRKLELNIQAHEELINYCMKKNIIFLSTPFDVQSANMLHKLKLEIFKIPSGEITNLPYLRYIGSLRKKVILSTGMSNLSEIKEALEVLIDSGTQRNNITILHSNTMYPTPIEDVNLNAMQTIKNEFGVPVGYSDHTLGIEIPIAAVALGASCIEKHFTTDKSLDGPDHKASLDPIELRLMVKSIRNIEIGMGGFEKKPSPSEIPNLLPTRKSICAARAIKKGEIFTEENITTKRPANGLSPMLWDQVINKVATKNYQVDDLICD